MIIFTYLFVVDLSIADSDGNCLVKLHTDLMIKLLHSSWYDTSLLIVIWKTQHRECLTGPRLPVAHDSSVVPGHYIGHSLRRREVIDIVLSCIEHDLIELELPVIEGVVDGAIVFFVAVDVEVLYKSKYGKYQVLWIQREPILEVVKAIVIF